MDLQSQAPLLGRTQRTPLGMKTYFLLAVILATLQGLPINSVFTINNVNLTVLPSSVVNSGTNVTLQCFVDLSVTNNRPNSFEYNFLNNDVVVYSKSHSENVLLYQIASARASTSGNYKCRVKVEGTDDQSNSEKLKVLGLQTPILSVSKHSILEGDNVTLNCSAPLETGSFIFTFYKNSVEYTQVRTTNNVAKVQMKLKESASFYCNFQVMTVPDAGTSNNSNTLSITTTESLKEPIMEIHPSHNIIEGDALTIVCRSSTDPRFQAGAVKIFLRKGDKILKAGNGSVSHSMIAQADDSGEYECKAENERRVRKSAKKILRVTELFSKPVLVQSPAEIDEGKPFNLTCHVENKIFPDMQLKYTIYKNITALTSGSPDGSYTNDRPTLDDEGFYHCSAVAEFKPINKTSKEIFLKVHTLVSTPTIAVSGNVILNKPFSVVCRSDRGSVPISYTLMRGSEAFKTLAVWTALEPAHFTVTIKTKEEIRDFTCEAQNRGPSSVRTSAALNASVIEPVSSAELQLITGPDVAEGQSLTLQCQAVGGTLPIEFHFYKGGQEFQPDPDKSGRHWSHIIKAVTREDSGTYYCDATNRAGETRSSAKLTVNVTLALWKLALIGLFCVLLLLAIAAFCVIWHKSRAAKKDTAAELSVKPSSPKSDDSLTVSLTNETEVYNKGAAVPHSDVTEGKAANGTRGSIASLPVSHSNRSSCSNPATV
ncbi:platelet endothelial cell adhesion molecule isoform X2 [Amia ocellicauda]|uniref:platelet endothelial cell adhesion molecule isoform X2 n=1 Tax=Amia ocellicauda TaxID=2972642 RepID=UPI0034648DE5